MSRIDLRLAILDMGIRHTERRGHYERLANLVRFVILAFFVLLVVRCFGPWGGKPVDVVVALSFVAAGAATKVLDPSARARAHAESQRNAYGLLARLEATREDDAEGIASIASDLLSAQAKAPPVGERARRRSLRGARVSLGLDPT